MKEKLTLPLDLTLTISSESSISVDDPSFDLRVGIVVPQHTRFSTNPLPKFKLIYVHMFLVFMYVQSGSCNFFFVWFIKKIFWPRI